MLIATQLKIPEKQRHTIARAAKLHDIGKLVIDIAFINKPGPLTKQELILFRKHPSTGASLLKELRFLSVEAELILHHHERHDGKGYPRGKSGDTIPFGASIISLADALDAMLSSRSYKEVMTLSEAIEEVKKNKGTQFHPKTADAFLDIMKNNKESFIQLLAPASPSEAITETITEDIEE